MRWVFWTGGLMTVGGMWWLFQGVDLAAGGQDRTALVGGATLFLLGMVIMGWGMGTRRQDG
ncbi:hypothetical protein BRD56_04920 [Thermoplasmatales archaeon SW_10_69_26]|nr:MAG: hypothetical protein BRD56_04920 [Thermoplasmatales archaeon SW_10_69_26]